MDARTQHLIAMVMDGATLEDAGRVYGISRERVRQILKGEGIRAKELPGRGQKRRSRRLSPSCHPTPGVETVWCELPRELAPVIEAMWREGMLYHEIASVFDSSCEAIHRLICERVSVRERPAQALVRDEGGRSSDTRLVAGMRKAASVLAESHAINGDVRRHAQAAINGWLAAHSQLTEAPNATSPTELTKAPGVASRLECLTPLELRSALDRFKAELEAGGLKGSTIHFYLVGSSLFVRWLGGDYVPGARGRGERACVRGAEVPS